MLGAPVHSALAAWILGAPMPTAPTSLRLALSAGDPTEDGSGLNEPVGAGYARQIVTATAAAYPSGGTLITITGAVIFGPVVGSNWPTLTHGALFAQDGTLLAFGPLGVNRTAPVGDTISFGPGALQFLVK